MATQNSGNQKFTNNADGFDIAGGTTARKLTLSGADVSVVGSGTAVITFPSTTSTLATLGANTFTGTQALGANNLTMTGSLAATGARVTKGWFTDIESTNIPTVGGNALLTSLTAPQFTTIELGNATDTTLARVSAGVVSIEGNNVVTNTSSPTLGTVTTTGNIELGNASDTTLARVSAGVVSIEGNNIITANNDVTSLAAATANKDKYLHSNASTGALEWSTVSSGAAIPSGTVLPYAGSSAPTGYLLADGSAVSRTTYADLYAIVGTTYGSGDGSTTFNVPDLRANVPVGYKASDTNFGTLGGKGGETTHTLTTTEMPAHTHTIDMGSNTSGITAIARIGYSASFTETTSSVGGGGAHNNLQPYITLNYIIKT